MSKTTFNELLESIPAAFHRLGASGDHLHAPLGLSSGMRGLLLSLERLGPMTVSQLAALRPVSRQFVQRVADEMIAGGWIHATHNPKHKRSPLMVITAEGERTLRKMQEVEAPYLEELGAGLSAEDIEVATRILRTIAERISPEILDQLADGAVPVAAMANANG